jgi:hypothetical protein
MRVISAVIARWETARAGSAAAFIETDANARIGYPQPPSRDCRGACATVWSYAA